MRIVGDIRLGEVVRDLVDVVLGISVHGIFIDSIHLSVTSATRAGLGLRVRIELNTLVAVESAGMFVVPVLEKVVVDISV